MNAVTATGLTFFIFAMTLVAPLLTERQAHIYALFSVIAGAAFSLAGLFL